MRRGLSDVRGYVPEEYKNDLNMVLRLRFFEVPLSHLRSISKPFFHFHIGLVVRKHFQCTGQVRLRTLFRCTRPGPDCGGRNMLKTVGCEERSIVWMYESSIQGSSKLNARVGLSSLAIQLGVLIHCRCRLLLFIKHLSPTIL